MPPKRQICQNSANQTNKKKQSTSQPQETAISVSRKAQRMLTVHPVYPNTLDKLLYAFQFTYKQNRKHVKENERLITWNPQMGEIFLITFRMLSQIQTIDHDARDSESDGLHIVTCFHTTTVLQPKQKQSFIYLPGATASRCMWLGNASTHIGEAFSTNLTLLCYFVIDFAGEQNENTRILVTDIVMQNGQILAPSAPSHRRLLLNNIRPHLPPGFQVQETWPISALPNFRENTPFTRSVPHGVNGVLEFTDNPLAPILMKQPLPKA
eukprot:3853138-Rhodomonas_salina.2